MNDLSGKTAAVFLIVGIVVCLTWLSAANAGEAKAGKAQYDKLCVSCHGADGKGNPAMAKAMGEKGLNLTTKEVKDAKDEDLLKVITGGRGKMPASGKSLSKAEQKEVLDFVRSLGK
jgi:cytochrome c oxidase cbb3-type subunit III